MAELQEVLLLVNILIAVGTAISGAISYARGGFLHKFIHAVEKIDSTERRVQEINSWRSNVEVVLVAVSENVDNVKENRVKNLFGEGVTVTELTIKEQDGEMKEDSDNAM